MKVAVITRHAITNYGSLLQSIATQKLIERCGHSCEILDYVRPDETPGQWEKTSLATKKEWNQSALKKMAYLALRQPAAIHSGRKFEQMRKQYLHMSSRCQSEKDLAAAIQNADAVMTGSDQVWGPVSNGGYDSAYFLSFVPAEKRRIAFSASMGKMNVDEKNAAMFRKYLPAYHAIAVREQAAADFLEQYGVRSKVVLDPTLLISGAEWAKMAAPAPKEKYLLIYQLHNDPKLKIYADQIAKRLGVKIIRASASWHQCMRGGKFVYLPHLSEFLSLIQNASYMVTDSFHGTAFAINFNTPFSEVLPENGTNSRNLGILSLVGLQNQIVTCEKDTETVALKHDFSSVNKILNEKRTESMQILREMLS